MFIFFLHNLYRESELSLVLEEVNIQGKYFSYTSFVSSFLDSNVLAPMTVVHLGLLHFEQQNAPLAYLPFEAA